MMSSLFRLVMMLILVVSVSEVAHGGDWRYLRSIFNVMENQQGQFISVEQGADVCKYGRSSKIKAFITETSLCIKM